MNLQTKLDEVAREYRQRMTQHDHSQLLAEVEQYITDRKGKMLRPKMTLLAAATMGEECLNSNRTLLLATAIEMLHNVSLLHDDVIDHADKRRGQESVNHRWGNSVAVLVGDFLLAQIMLMMDTVNDAEATRRINRTVMQMVEAELIAQEVMLGKRELNKETYLSIIDGKTACLFATAAAFGNPEYEDFGLHYGRLFQLLDDQADNEDNCHTAQLIKEEKSILATIANLPLQ